MQKLLMLFIGLLVPGFLLLTPAHVSAESVHFSHAGHQIKGWYQVPNNEQDIKGVILFVHGDGPMPYDAHGYYNPLWQMAHDAGYAIFSWDKPGVGDSGGNWLHQSMQDRQSETRAAIDFLKAQFKHASGKIGLMGFSQAGWVVPSVAANNKDVDFVIGVGFAINWMQQSWYLTETRLQQEGADASTIENARIEHQAEHDFLRRQPDYATYLDRQGDDDNAMSRDRYDFVLRNYHVDATDSLAAIQQPFLLLLGKQDLNVDIQQSARITRQLFKGKTNIDIRLLDGASHGLLKADDFPGPSMGLMEFVKLLWQGEDAFVSELRPTLTNWLKDMP